MLTNLNGGGGGVKVFSQPNEGAFSARNRALKESTGEYIMFMDCDDFISHHKVQRQIEILRENDPYTIVSCKWDTFYLNIEESTFPKRCVYKNYHTPIDMLIEMLNKGEMMLISCWMISRELIKGPDTGTVVLQLTTMAFIFQKF